MSSHESKIESLVNLALGTEREEEARTAALLAIRLAAKTGAVIRVRGGKKASAKADSPPAPEPRPRARRYRVDEDGDVRPDEDDPFDVKNEPPFTPPRKQGSDFTCRFADKPGSCKHCGGRWAAGEVVAQRAGERSTFHASCASQRR